MRSVSSSDEIVGIRQGIAWSDQIVCGERIHVMNKKPRVNLMAWHSEIAAIVSNDYEVSELLPLMRPIEVLI